MQPDSPSDILPVPHPVDVMRFAAIWILAATALTLRADDVDFDREIRPILSENCFFCHGPDANRREADLRLDTRDEAMSMIEPSDREASELFARIASDDPEALMPPPESNRELTREQIEMIGRWIDQGAAWTDHWSFRPLEKPVVPTVEPFQQAPIRNPIDAFVQRELRRRGMHPAAEADRRTLIRRLSLDLRGLPPTLEEVDQFVSDQDPEAYDRLVQRMLDSPAYGQRMAWNWLDAARYADTNGYQGDRERTMWPWRDWVVGAFNQNLPYDQFTLWQLAGDLLPDATDEQELATGFCRNHMINGEGGRIAEENRVEYVMDMTETMGTVWLGLTLNCCRCHDHKYDPITNQEYYQLFSFFNQTPVSGGGGDPQTAPNLPVPDQQQRTRLAELTAELADADVRLAELAQTLEPQQAAWEEQQAKELRLTQTDSEKPEPATAAAALVADLSTPRDERTDEQQQRIVQAYRQANPAYQQLKERRDAIAKQRSDLENSIPKVMVMADMLKPRQTFMLQRGLYNKPTDPVTAALPAFLPTADVISDDPAPNRLTLARWLVHDQNPLTARVTINRFWKQIFGIGLVKTPEDFGRQGEIPLHRDLLNWLAAEFRDSGWNVKALMRTIVTSHTYRQSSRIQVPEDFQNDPDNRLLARGARYRLPSWMLRDQALAVSGLLSPIDGGPAVNTYQPEGVWEEASFGNKKYARDSGDKLYRRSLYIFWRRIIAPTMFFDSASRQTCTVKEGRTNTPLHALQTLNNIAYVEAARALAQLALQSEQTDDSGRIDFVMLRVLARRATGQEQAVLVRGLERTRGEFRSAPEDAQKLISLGESPRDESIAAVEHASWTSLCLALLNLDETLSRE